MPGKPPKASTSPIDDIPEALRDTPDTRRKLQLTPILIVSALVGIGVIALSIGVLLSRPASQSPPLTQSQAEGQTGATTTPSAGTTDTLLGHFTYQEAPASELQPITADGRLMMRKAASQKFQAMVSAARASGVSIVPISGFRSVAEQQHLFFDVKAQRGQVTTKRAEVSAPPGYSEHHTGYAADLGDGNVPATNLSPSFENTGAFQWLQKNAAFYSFELSFPKNNRQGVSYEPWHWRFVGDQDSLETFYKAKNVSTNGQP